MTHSHSMCIPWPTWFSLYLRISDAYLLVLDGTCSNCLLLYSARKNHLCCVCCISCCALTWTRQWERVQLRGFLFHRTDYGLWVQNQNHMTPRQYRLQSVWPDWAIYCNLGNFSKPVATIILPKSHTFWAIFGKVSKSFISLVKSFLGNFYRHLATFIWSSWLQ